MAHGASSPSCPPPAAVTSVLQHLPVVLLYMAVNRFLQRKLAAFQPYLNLSGWEYSVKKQLVVAQALCVSGVQLSTDAESYPEN